MKLFAIVYFKYLIDKQLFTFFSIVKKNKQIDEWNTNALQAGDSFDYSLSIPCQQMCCSNEGNKFVCFTLNKREGISE